MKKHAIWLFIAAVGLAVSGGLLQWLMSSVEGLTAAYVFLDADILAKMFMLLILLLQFAVLGLGLAAVIMGRGRMNTPLFLVGLAAIGFGLLGAGYTVMTTQQIAARMGGVSFEITAPSYAGAALSATLGFFTATLAFVLRWLGDRRS
ncbi:hypothetical protein [Brevundimonas sp. Root1279]|uniref:hypothetical protein n=1 Tax=Brevundimonas sp. Root1279 TaxID=1736443 RepID=UPI0006F50F3A|nr:hypothetical protein [Brevundimonas sp. Root1279]KQW81848.1 hypothetical protein ASC65_11205 [Brevundimonas sp. Root1279]